PGRSTSAPLASNLNFSVGETVANLVKVGLSQGGQITVVTNVKSADVIVDVEGYVSALPTAGQGLYDGLAPARICDTRSSSLPVNQCTGKTMKPNSTMTVQVAGLGGVPANAEAVAVNVTVTDTTAAGYLTVFPGGARPTASNLNWASGRTVPNLVVVELNSSGGLTLYNYAGSTDVVLDVLGYYT
ncbi:peptidase S8 and S53, partial [mine drainage metagenome]